MQLLNYMHSARYPVHDLAIGAQDVEIAMDCAGDSRESRAFQKATESQERQKWLRDRFLFDRLNVQMQEI